MRAIIVGGGIMGLTTAWGFARLGHEVDLFEQGPLPNPLASSMDEHRLIRHPYGDQAAYARMVDEAYRAWSVLWSDLGQVLHVPTGTLALTGNGSDWAERSAATLGAIGKPMTELSRAELSRRFPLIEASSVDRAFWIDTGGVLLAQDIVVALTRYLRQRGRVRLHAEMQIRSVDLEHGRVISGAGTIHGGDVVVVATGAWAPRLLPALAARVVPSRQIVAYFDLPEDQRAAWSKGPMIIEKTGDVGLYLVPPVAGRGMKIGDHEFSRTGNPDASRTSEDDEIRPLLDRCRSLLAGFENWRTQRLHVCFYSVTEDERFVVEKQGARGWAMSPCSGHGFKFGAVMGLALARTIAESRDATAHARWAAGLAGDRPT